MLNKYLKHFSYYFYKEFQHITNELQKENAGVQLLGLDPEKIDNFEENRQNGENPSYICGIIRQDAIEDFVVYVNRNNYSLSSRIKPSFYEANTLLIDNDDITLIEYAVFFGSIQIFQFLRLNGDVLSPSLWIYAIHSKNPELIHLLEENKVIPKDESYKQCFEEAIKCHHNDIANYINDNLLIKNNTNNENLEMNKRHFYECRCLKLGSFNLSKEYDKNINAYGFRYHNHEFMQNDFKSKFFLHYLCQYNYISLVKLFINETDIDINSTISKEIMQKTFINDIPKRIILNDILSSLFFI